MEKKTKKNRYGELYVTSKIRAGQNGKTLRCPKCNRVNGNHVYHFSWSALKCQNCGAMVEKETWAVVDAGQFMTKADEKYYLSVYNSWRKEFDKKHKK